MEDKINFDRLSKIFTPEDMGIIKDMTKVFMNMKVTKWNDHSFTPGFSADAAKFAYNNWNMREGDVLLASYPKTGTIWTAEVLQQIMFANEKDYAFASNLPAPFGILEFDPCEKYALIDKLPLKNRLMMSHLPGNLVNMEKLTKANAKVVYVLRNPKDQMVSFYNFLQKVPPGAVEPIKSIVGSGWENFFNRATNGDIPSSSRPGEWYPDHIRSWYKYRDNKNVFFLYFEDMKRDLEEQVKNLAKFLEVPITDERAKQIAFACTFDNMKKAKASGEGMVAKLTNINMRKGGVGGWKDHFTVSQSECVDKIMEEKLKDTNIKFTYEL